MKRILLVLAGIFFYHSVLNSQLKTVSGRITFSRTIPLRHALITVKSSNQSIYSDELGYFFIQCSPNDQLFVSSEGFNKRKVKIHEETKYAYINLKPRINIEPNSIPVGYGYVNQGDELYAMSYKNEKDLNFSRYDNIYDVLQTNFNGVQVINNSVVIRSSYSFGRNASALLIVDGSEVSKGYFSNIVPGDIAEINVLKDGAASVYGNRGANGVVIVETKRGYNTSSVSRKPLLWHFFK
jgi:TonB-dependent SusC/RagA subfamily outer membrane receptor